MRKYVSRLPPSPPQGAAAPAKEGAPSPAEAAAAPAEAAAVPAKAAVATSDKERTQAAVAVEEAAFVDAQVSEPDPKRVEDGMSDLETLVVPAGGCVPLVVPACGGVPSALAEPSTDGPSATEPSREAVVLPVTGSGLERCWEFPQMPVDGSCDDATQTMWDLIPWVSCLPSRTHEDTRKHM